MRNFFAMLALIVATFISTTTFAQHSLQLDNGAGAISIIKAAPGAALLTLPSGTGTLIMDNGSGVSNAWLVTGNTVTTMGIFGTNAGSAFDVSMVANGVEKMRLVSGGGVLVSSAGLTVAGTLDLTGGDLINSAGVVRVADGFIVTGTSDLQAAISNSLGNVTINDALNVTGATTLSNLTSVGVVHNSAAGLLSTSLILNADITNSTIDLTTKVTGILPIANGGTGSATVVAANQFFANTTANSAPAFRSIAAADLPALSYWGLTGNAGTTPGTNFVGTTDNAALRIQVTNAGTVNNNLTLNTNKSIQRDNLTGVTAGNARGADAVDLQSSRAGATQVASGAQSVIGGGLNNTANGAQSTVGGGQNNNASGVQSTVGGGLNNPASGAQSTVGGGSGNNANNTYATVGGGQSNTASGQNSTVGGGMFSTATGTRATVGGGLNNATNDESTVGGGFGNNASGYSSTIAGGIGNAASGSESAVGGGRSNSASGTGSFVGGGGNNGATIAGNTAGGNASTVTGGWGNTASGTYSTIPGGSQMTLDAAAARSFGFNGNNAALTRAITISAPNVAVFNDVDFWLASNDGTTRAIKFFSNNLNAAGAFPGVGVAKYAAIKAPDALAADITYTLPLTAPTAGQVLSSAVGGVMSWVSPSSTSWSLTGNAGTTAGTNFVGTTDNAALYLQVTSGGTVNNNLSLNNNKSIQRDNLTGVTAGNARGADAVDMQSTRTLAAQVASGANSVIGGGSNNSASNTNATVGGGNANFATGLQSTVSGGNTNYATGIYSTVGGGYFNTASGDYSTVPGGNQMALSAAATGSFGFNGNVPLNNRNIMISAPYVAVFNDVDLWLASNDGTTRALKFFSNNDNIAGAFPVAAKFAAIKAPDALVADITYTLPLNPPTAGQVLSSTAGGVMSWITDAPAPVGANPTATIGTAAVNGIATTFMRSDAAPAFGNLTGNVTSVGMVTTIPASTVTNIMLAGSIDLTTKVTNILPIANGGTGSATVGGVNQFFANTGAGSAPAFRSIVAADLPAGTGTVTSVSGTANRITSTGGATPVIDIDAGYIGQGSITTLGTITAGIWNGTSIADANVVDALTISGGTITNSPISGNTVSTTGLTLAGATSTVTLGAGGVGTSGQVLTSAGAGATPTWTTPTTGTVTSVSGTANRITSTGGATPVIDIAGTYVGQTSITTLGTITTGTWNGTSIADANVVDALTISGGSINSTPVGATSASTGAFTTLSASGVLTASTGTSGIVFGTGLNATTLTSTATVARAISFPDAAGTLALDVVGGYLPLSGGNMAGAINMVNNNINNGGTITGSAFSGGTGSFSTLTSVLNSTIGTGATALANSFGTGGNALNVINTIGSTGAGSVTTINGTTTANIFSSSGATITGGTINGTSVGATTPSTGAFTTLTASDNLSLTGSNKTLSFKGNGAGVSTFTAGLQGATSINYTLPIVAPLANQVLSSDGSGAMSWVTAGGTVTGGGTLNQIAIWSAASVLTSNALLTYSGTTFTLGATGSTNTIAGATTINSGIANTDVTTIGNTTAGGNVSINAAAANSVAINAAATVSSAATSTANALTVTANSVSATNGALSVSAQGAKILAFTGTTLSNTATSSTAAVAKTGVDIQSTGAWSGVTATNTALNVNATGGTTNTAINSANGNVILGNTGTAAELRLAEPSASGTNYNAFKTAAQATDITYTLPTAAPLSNSVLTSTTGGAMSWTSVASVGSAVFAGNTDGNLGNGDFVMVGNISRTTESKVHIPVTRAGTIKNLYVVLDAAPGAGATRTITFRKNGANTAISVTLTGAGAGPGITTGNDVVNTVSVVAGDLISIGTAILGGPTGAVLAWGIDFAP